MRGGWWGERPPARSPVAGVVEGGGGLKIWGCWVAAAAWKAPWPPDLEKEVEGGGIDRRWAVVCGRAARRRSVPPAGVVGAGGRARSRAGERGSELISVGGGGGQRRRRRQRRRSRGRRGKAGARRRELLRVDRFHSRAR